MRISVSTTPPTITGTLRTTASPPPSTVPPPQDVLQISEAAKQKIDQLQQGDQALQQAVAQSRQATRSAAQERVGSAKEYLKILALMSPDGDRGAASEAARIAREIRSATAEFKGSIAVGEEAGVRSEIAGFAGVAGDALKIAGGLVHSYLRKRTEQHKGDTELEKEIGSAISTVGEMVNGTQAPVHFGASSG